METGKLELGRGMGVVLATVSIAMAILATSCGGGGGGVAAADPVSATDTGVDLSAGALTFGSQLQGTASLPQTVTVKNHGNQSLGITSIAVSGANPDDFPESNTCGSSLGAGGNCTISVIFQPTATGTRTANVAVTEERSHKPHNVKVTGTATASAASLSPTSLTFASQAVGATSAAQAITLSNTGSTSLCISSMAFTATDAADFTEVDTCRPSVAAGGNCTIAVLFTPSAIGTRTAALSITDNASGSPQSVSLSGSGMHDVILSWTASTTPGVTGYNVYRGKTSGGESSTPLNSTPLGSTTYTDANVTAGATYYYLVTAIASNEVTQSATSNEAAATIPSP